MSRTSTRLGMIVLQILAASVILAATAYSQGADSGAVRQTNSLRAGAWALQFQEGRDFTLGSFDGTTLSIQKHTSAGGAWRLGVTLSGNVQQVKYANTYVQGGTNQERSYKTDINAQSLILGLTRIVYPRPPSAVNFLYGLGPRFSYGRTHDEMSSSTVDPHSSTSRNWSIGLGIVLGVQWFPYRSIGLSGEYSSSLVYRWQEDENLSTSISSGARSDTVDTTRGFSLANGGVRLGVSVYW